MNAAARRLGPDDLVLSASTLHTDTPLPDRVAAAAAAGFAGIGLRAADRERALAAGATDDELRAALAAAGLQVVELQALGDWGLGGEAGAKARAIEERLYALAAALGGRYVIAVGEVEDDLALTVERFGALCDRAAVHGLRIALEFVPWTTIPDARAAWEIVRRAERPNAVVLVDAWHHFRGAGDEAALLAIPPDRVAGIHLCDAAATPIGSATNDARHHLRLPGDGTFDLDRFVRLLDGHGVRVPLAVEVLSDELHALPAREAAAAAAAATRRVAARARAG